MYSVLTWEKPRPRPPSARERLEAGRSFYVTPERKPRSTSSDDEPDLDSEAALAETWIAQQREPKDLISAPVPAPEPPEAGLAQ